MPLCHQDAHHKWYEAVVIQASEVFLTVRFLGWSPQSHPDKYDENVPRRSNRIVPYTTKVRAPPHHTICPHSRLTAHLWVQIRAWRRVQVGDEVELRVDRHVDNTVVREVDQEQRTVKVADSATWYNLEDMFSLACYGTHKRTREWATVDRESDAAPPLVPITPETRMQLHPSLVDATDDVTAAKQELVASGYDSGDVAAAMEAAGGDATAAAFIVGGCAAGAHIPSVPAEDDSAASPASCAQCGCAVATAVPSSAGMFTAPRPTGPLPTVACRALSRGTFTPSHHGEVDLRCSPTSLSITMWLKLQALPTKSACLARQEPVDKLVHPLPPGTLVEGRYSQGASPWYPGRVDGVNSDGTYNGTRGVRQRQAVRCGVS